MKHPDTGSRLRKVRPQSEWVITEYPEPAIVTREVWEAAQARARAKSIATPNHTRRAAALVALRGGILRCGECGSPMVSIDRYRYGCSV